MKNSILIIANGPSTLKKKLGDIIDKFENIARINNYEISGFKNYIGSKTEIWFNGGNQKLKPRPDFKGETIVFIPYKILEKKADKIVERTSKRLKLNSDQYTLVSKEKMKYFEELSNIQRPTTGLNSILWSLDNYKKIFIYGFDFFLKGKEHYYDSSIRKKIANLNIIGTAKKHDNEAERLFVQGLVQEKRIVQLTEYLKES